MLFVDFGSDMSDLFNLRYTGDLVLQGVQDKGENLLSNIATDGLIINLESPFINESHKKIKNKVCLHSDSNSFSVVKNISPYLVNISNNHINDFGTESAKYTIELMQSNNIQVFGVGLPNDNSHVVIDFEKRLVNVSYTDRSSDLTGSKLHSDVYFYGPKPVNIPELKKLREKYPDYVIVVSVHWGLEDISLPTPEIRTLAKNISESDVDIIIGHHPHIIQPFEKVGDTLIFYSLGNLHFPEIEYEFEGKYLSKTPLEHQCKGLLIDITYSDRKNIEFSAKLVLNNKGLILTKEHDLKEINQVMYSFEFIMKNSLRLYGIYSVGVCNKLFSRVKKTWLYFSSRVLNDEMYLKLIFYKTLKYRLDLKSPKTLNEKLQWSKLNLVTEDVTQCADKLRVRDYISKKIGEKYLVPIVSVIEDVDKLVIEDLPDSPFIMKANHTSGTYKIVWNKYNLDIEQIKEMCRSWLAIDYSTYNKEYQYKNIEPRVYIEELLIDSNGEIPNDIKFSCINGKVEIIHVDSNKEREHLRNNYSKEWELLEFDWPKNIKRGDIISRPISLDKMVELAEVIALDFTFVRVDFYTVSGKIYFGEITFHPTSGFGEFSEYKYDLLYGNKLELGHV